MFVFNKCCVTSRIGLTFHYWWGHLQRMKNLYCSRMVKRKKTTPSVAMANRFLPTKSHCRGSTFCLVPGGRRTYSLSRVVLYGF